MALKGSTSELIGEQVLLLPAAASHRHPSSMVDEQVDELSLGQQE